MTELPGLVTFECELSKPNVKVQWLKSGKPILPNKKFEVAMDGSVHRLVIRDIVNEEDIAEYTATVRGKSSKATLKINGEISVAFMLHTFDATGIFHIIGILSFRLFSCSCNSYNRL